MWCWRPRLLSSSCSAAFSAFVCIFKRDHHQVHVPAHRKEVGNPPVLKGSLASYPVTSHTQLASTEFCGHSLEAEKYSLYLSGHVLLKTSPAVEKSFGGTMSDHFHNQGQSPGVMVSLLLRKTRSQPHREGGRGSVDRDEFAGKRTSTCSAIRV